MSTRIVLAVVVVMTSWILAAGQSPQRAKQPSGQTAAKAKLADQEPSEKSPLPLAAVTRNSNSEPQLPPDVEGKPLSPADALARVTVPPGFRVTQFAHEPDIRQPIAMTFDDRGRLWVAECYSYPDRKIKNQDRVVILEDTNQDGQHDKRTVFWSGGNMLSGIEYGYGGIWVCCAPNLLFIPDKDGDDVPDAEPIVMLDGWSTDAKHNLVNGLKWGPDGWLYGCNGILSNSNVGVPGTAAEKRVRMNCGIWRFHPTRKTFEVVAHGTTNPWGVDFNQYGDGFFTNCVIDHAWQLVPGARYERMFGQDFNPYAYELMTSTSDHKHWGGGSWTDSRGGKGEHDNPGGGHAHSGTLIYLGDNFPQEYYGSLMTCNIHGNRVNRDTLERKGSGYVAKHAADFFKANDPWFRGVALAMGPDGGVYIADWSDTGECHDAKDVHRASGRIYKVKYGKAQKGPFISGAHVRRDYAYQVSQGVGQKAERQAMLAIKDWPIDTEVDAMAILPAIWALNATGGVPQVTLLKFAEAKSDAVASTAIRLLFGDENVTPETVKRLTQLSTETSTPTVRLSLASAMQRLRNDQRWPIAEGLVSHADDQSDANLQRMIWYGIEPAIPTDILRAIKLAHQSKLPKISRFIARRLCESDLRAKGLPAVIQAIAGSESSALARQMLTGVREALAGVRALPMPDGWMALSSKLSKSDDAELLDTLQGVSLIFGESKAIAALTAKISDAKLPVLERRAAIDALVERRVAGLPRELHPLLDEPTLRIAALRGLAAYDDWPTAGLIIERYKNFSEAEQIEALNTLASRATFAAALLKAVEQKRIPRGDIAPYTARQLAAIKNKDVEAKLSEVIGTVRPSAEDKLAIKAKFKQQLTTDVLQRADMSRGRQVFSKMCAQCHRLFDDGAKVGPDLTGAQRANLDYVLENVLDPNALVGKDYQLTIVTLNDGRVISGIIEKQNDATLSLKTTGGPLLLSKSDIDDLQQSLVSMMPEGQLEKLSLQEVRDLVGYLGSPAQVPLP